MNEGIWKFVELAIAGAVTSAVFSWLLKHRSAAGDRGFGALVLRYSFAMHVVAWALLGIPLAGLAALWLWQPPKPDEVVYFVGMVLGFGLLGGALVLEARGVAHQLRPDGLERVTPWRGRRLLPWSQVKVLRFSDSMQCWRVVTTSGDATWISVYVSGLGAFARAVLQHVRPEVIDREPVTRAKLVELAAAAGAPPSSVGAGSDLE